MSKLFIFAGCLTLGQSPSRSVWYTLRHNISLKKRPVNEVFIPPKTKSGNVSPLFGGKRVALGNKYEPAPVASVDVNVDDDEISWDPQDRSLSTPLEFEIRSFPAASGAVEHNSDEGFMGRVRPL
ncbi:hypothetical protein BDQ17DRAFT_1323685 [Cyathus striatus]|nr:hypothetical protein BDQ17DRAFT_1323685 [Cyathus striatus]